MTRQSRLFAVIPAAGHSRRMGQPKLLLPVGNKTVIRRLLDVLECPAVTDRVVVLRRDDVELKAEADAAAAVVVQPAVDPPDMRTSVTHAIAEIRRRHRPRPQDGWLLVPGDHPLLDAAVLDLLLTRWQTGGDRILVPTFRSRRGHPTFFRWEFSEQIAALPSDCGLNELLERNRDDVTEFAVESPAVVIDLDTPDDYNTLLGQVGDEK